ncbi:hypothetical protein BC835DRAFT_1396451 [Cytidiella melzeri]|nr:hypothetical protein BC835DRAFT_1396451 [Cytidiella melzeri]
MQFSTSLILLATVFTGTVHMMIVSATLCDRRESHSPVYPGNLDKERRSGNEDISNLIPAHFQRLPADFNVDPEVAARTQRELKYFSSQKQASGVSFDMKAREQDKIAKLTDNSEIREKAKELAAQYRSQADLQWSIAKECDGLDRYWTDLAFPKIEGQ